VASKSCPPRRAKCLYAMNGRRYFDDLARRLKLEGLDPGAIQELPPLEVKRGTSASKRGGRIARDLTRLSPEETAERQRLSEEFLKRPAERVPEEEDENDDED